MEKQIVGIVGGRGSTGWEQIKPSLERRSQQLGCEVPPLRLQKAAPLGPIASVSRQQGQEMDRDRVSGIPQHPLGLGSSSLMGKDEGATC